MNTMFRLARPGTRNAQYNAASPEGGGGLTGMKCEADRGSVSKFVQAFTKFNIGALLVLVVTLALPYAAFSQVLYGSLTGNVTDQKGAVVPGAKVTAANTGTRASKTTTTDERGGYLFTDLLTGTYNVTIEASSFKTVIEENVRVESNTSHRV